MCHGFRPTKRDDYFESLLKRESFFEATVAVAKIGVSLNPDHNNQVKHVKLVL